LDKGQCKGQGARRIFISSALRFRPEGNSEGSAAVSDRGKKRTLVNGKASKTMTHIAQVCRRRLYGRKRRKLQKEDQAPLSG